MEPAHTPEPHEHHQPQPVNTPMPPFPAQPTHRMSGGKSMISGLLARTSSAFTAEYSVFLIALGILLSNLAALTYIFFDLIVVAIHGGASYAVFPTYMFVLWLGVSSFISGPLTFVLWKRVRGELAANEQFKGEVPRGGAAGFRTFWLVVVALSGLAMLVAALYAPLVTALSGVGVLEALLAITIPSFVNIAVLIAGAYLVTRKAANVGKSLLLLVVTLGLTTVLFLTDYIWSYSARNNTTEPAYDSPSKSTDPYTTTPYDYNYDTTPQYYNY